MKNIFFAVLLGLAATSSALAETRPGILNLSPDLMASCSLSAMYARAFQKAQGHVAQPWVQRVEFNNHEGSGAIAFMFQDLDSNESYFVRLTCDGTVVYEQYFPAKNAPFLAMRDLSVLQVTMETAFAKAFRLAPGAVWNKASIIVRSNPSGFDYTFWSSWDWKNQPMVVIDAVTGATKLCRFDAQKSEDVCADVR